MGGRGEGGMGDGRGGWGMGGGGAVEGRGEVFVYAIIAVLWYRFSPNRPTGPIRSSSRDVRVFVCVLSPQECFFLAWTESVFGLE